MSITGTSPLIDAEAIEERIKEVGRKLGVPEDQALRLVEIESRERLIRHLDALRVEQARSHQKIDWSEILSKVISYMAGLLKIERK